MAVLFAQGRKVRISYPDFIEGNGRLYISETQKSVARVHEIPNELLSRLWTPSRSETAHQ
ncbi:MAG: hypothetical protein HY706_05595 [Candidatus Hydrogenedentes bacterium]|nr:hypothetical protein [Candidatus Hydrogenedentota bacterium]